MNEILQGDVHDLIRTIPNDSIDLIVTSPPYANLKSYGQAVNIFHPDRYVDWFLPLQVEFYRILKPSGSFILNINDCCVNKLRHPYIYELIYRTSAETPLLLYDKYFWIKKGGYLPVGSPKRIDGAISEYIFHFCKNQNEIKFHMDRVRVPHKEGTKRSVDGGSKISLYKTNDAGEKVCYQKELRATNPLGKIPTNVFHFRSNNTTRGNKHPAPFHPDLPEWFIRALTDEGDVVLDPFMGSGTTALVAQRMNRNWLGIELNPVYIDMAMERLDPFHKM